MPVAPKSVNPIALLAGWFFLCAVGSAWAWAGARAFRGEPLVPRRPPRIVPWGLTAVLATIGLYFTLNVAAGLGYAALVPKRAFPPSAQLLLLAVINLGMVLLLPPLLGLISGARLADLGIGSTPAGPDVARGLAGALLATVPTYALMAAVTRVWRPQTHPLEQMIGADPGGRVALLALVSGVLLAPAAEELIFRGVLQGWLVRVVERGRLRRGLDPIAGPATGADDVRPEPAPTVLVEGTLVDDSPWDAPRAVLVDEPPPTTAPAPGQRQGRAPVMPNVITSVLFAALHFGQWPAPIPLFFLSMALGWLYQRTGGVLAPFVMHATFNGLSTAMLYVALLSKG